MNCNAAYPTPSDWPVMQTAYMNAYAKHREAKAAAQADRYRGSTAEAWLEIAEAWAAKQR